MKNFYFVTANPGKLKDAKQIFGENIKHIDVDLDEIQEMNANKIAEHKAKQAWKLVKKPVVIWDASIEIDCLNGFPGPLIKWFWQTVTLKKICQIAQMYKNNKILVRVTLTYYDGKRAKYISTTAEGTIPPRPRGKNGFGWDAIFIQKGSRLTNAQRDPNDHDMHKANRKALEALKKYLK